MDALDRGSVIRFFEWHGISPEKPRPNFVQYCKIMIDAYSISHSFGCFARESFIGDELRLGFESWDELWHCYKSFIAGYIGSR
jgi:hypothetical protein